MIKVSFSLPKEFFIIGFFGLMVVAMSACEGRTGIDGMSKIKRKVIFTSIAEMENV